eukprot:m.203976 g.203976  ORF g.203976 m.203976 type:complete len:476 (-) comp17080_c0_seq1:33-1460(-)
MPSLSIPGAVGLLLGATAIFLFSQVWLTPASNCSTTPVLCPNGQFSYAKGARCEVDCAAAINSTKLEARILWNAPIHSWTGIASEAVDFLVPLEKLAPHLELTGGYVNEYVHELPKNDQAVLEKLRDRHFQATQENLDRAAAGLPSARLTILVTQYDPGTYHDDLLRYQGDNLDYKIGRAMFETTSIPDHWKQPCKLMDEIWVPSKWGRDVFINAGVDADRLQVIPEAVDTSVFDPAKAKRLPELMLESDQKFAFLSVFKWEDRKGWDILIKAFALEFTSDESVALYLRSGRDKNRPEADVKRLLRELKVKTPPQITWIPPVPTKDYVNMYHTADAFVLPTHAEGFGRPIMEAMAMGLPVIVTNWSGQTEFVDDSTAFLLPSRGLEKAFPHEPQITGYDFEGKHKWAKVEIDDVRKVMRYVFTHQHVAKRTGMKGRQHVTSKFSRAAIAQQVERRLQTIQTRLSKRSVNTLTEPS